MSDDAEAPKPKKPRRKIATRANAQFRPLQRSRRHHIGDDRNAPHLSGEFSRHAADAADMLREMYESVDVAEVRDSGHYVAEENPADFGDKLLAFVRRNSW